MKCFLSHCSCYSLSCKIKYLCSYSHAHSFNRWKYSGYSLSNPCWGFDKELFLSQNSFVNPGDKLFLTFPIWKRKIKILDFFIPLPIPFHLPYSPLGILHFQTIKPIS